MIQVRYTPNEAAISGTLPELQRLCEDLRGFAEGVHTEFVIHLETTCNPAPYDSTLAQIVIIKTSEQLSIHITPEERVMTITGMASSIETLATYFDFPEGVCWPNHFHFEYYDDHPIIARGSIPLVISVH